MDDWLKGMPWKDWGVAFIGGVLTLGGIALTLLVRLFENRRQYMVQREQRAHEQSVEERKSEHLTDIAQTQDLTDRFQTLMNGYEGRIRDLTAEMTTMRGEMRELRQQFESHQRICRGCPHFNERMERFART